MPIQVACPNCQKQYNLAPRLAGKRVRCKSCQTDFPVPNEEVPNLKTNDDNGAAVRVAPEASVEQPLPVLELATPDEDSPPPPAKSRAWMFILIGGGVAAVLSLGCVAAGITGFFLVKRSTPPVVAVNTTPNNGWTPPPTLPPNTKPVRPPKTNPPPPPEPQPEPDDPPGPQLHADALREQVQALSNPSATLPLTNGVNNPVRFPWGLGPIVAVQDPKNNETVWDIWNLQSMKKLGSVKGASGADLKISADGTYVAMNTWVPGTIRRAGLEVYTVTDGKPLRMLQVKSSRDSTVGIHEFAGPGQFLSLQNEGLAGVATVYDVKTGEEAKTFKTVGRIDRKANVLSPGGKYLAMFDSWDFKHPIQVYDMATGKVVRTIKPKMPTPPNSNLSCNALVFSPDGKELAGLFSAGDADYVQAWDFETGKRTLSHKFTPALTKTVKAGGPWLVDTYPTPLEYLPDKSGWFAYGQLLIDHDRGTIIWQRPPENLGVLWQRRFLDPDHYVTVLVKSPSERRLEIVTLPKDEINAARMK
jgi:hypothetical protein